MDKQNFIKLIVDRLIELSITNDYISPLKRRYLTVLISYLRGDESELSLLADCCESSPSFFRNLVRVRHGILAKPCETGPLEELSKFLTEEKLTEDVAIWRGEAAFVLGMAHLENKSYESAKIYFQHAYRLLDALGAKKKAAKSLLNLVVAESRLHNHKKLIVDYEFVAKKSLQAGDPIVAGICYLNISREFQFIGSVNLALK